MEDSGFIGDPSRIRILEGVPEALLALARAGYERIVVTNQSGVARGMFGEPDVQGVHRALSEALGAHGASIDAYYYCAHLEGCDCRKPSPGMVRQAVIERHIDLERSVLFGDRASDMGLAARVGIPGILIDSSPKYDGPVPFFQTHSLLAGVTYFLENVACAKE